MSRQPKDRSRASHDEARSLDDVLDELEEAADSVGRGDQPTTETHDLLAALSEVLPPETLTPDEVAAAERQWRTEGRSLPQRRIVLAAAALFLVVTGVWLGSRDRSGELSVDRERILSRIPDGPARESAGRLWAIESAVEDLTSLRGFDGELGYEPRGAIGNLTPTFRFPVRDESLTYRVTIIGTADRRIYDGIAAGLLPGEAGPVATFEVSQSNPLEPGEYAWRSELDSTAHPREPKAMHRSESRPLTIFDPVERDELLNFESTGIPHLDMLLRAAVLSSAGLATEAKSILESMDISLLSQRERIFRDLLLLEARYFRDEPIAQTDIETLRARLQQPVR